MTIENRPIENRPLEYQTIECRHSRHEPGRCEDCLIATVHGLPPRPADASFAPLRAVSAWNAPADGALPDWILESPAEFDPAELEALAVLADAGLVPALARPMEPEGPDRPVDFWPTDWAEEPSIRSVG